MSVRFISHAMVTSCCASPMNDGSQLELSERTRGVLQLAALGDALHSHLPWKTSGGKRTRFSSSFAPRFGRVPQIAPERSRHKRARPQAFSFTALVNFVDESGWYAPTGLNRAAVFFVTIL